MEGKFGKAVGSDGFQQTFELLDRATEGGTTCEGNPINSTVLTIYNELKDCPKRAQYACDPSTIEYRFTGLECKVNETYCTSVCDVRVDKNCTKKKECVTNCPAKEGLGYAFLTKEMITHIQKPNECIDKLTEWTKRYAVSIQMSRSMIIKPRFILCLWILSHITTM